MNKSDENPKDSWVRNGLYSLLYGDVESTNALATALIEEKKIAGPTAIIAENQFSDRGQLRTKWHSAPRCNLTFSLALPKINIDISDQFKLNKCIALSIYTLLKEENIESNIKWPNDIYVNNKKLAGILIESQISGKKINKCVIGLGLNVNQTSWPDYLPNPISLTEVTGKSFDLSEIYDAWIPKIYENILRFLSKPEYLISGEYNSHLHGLNRLLTFKKNKTLFKAIIKGVNLNGDLVLQTESGETETYRFKEIEYILD